MILFPFTCIVVHLDVVSAFFEIYLHYVFKENYETMLSFQ